VSDEVGDPLKANVLSEGREKAEIEALANLRGGEGIPEDSRRPEPERARQ